MKMGVIKKGGIKEDEKKRLERRLFGGCLAGAEVIYKLYEMSALF